MLRCKPVLAFITMAALSACSGMGNVFSQPPADPSNPLPGQEVVSRAYDLEAFSFSAPEGLRISEADNYYPLVDVVWRGDPIGNRITQIEALFSTAADRNQSVLTGARAVDVTVELVRFHGVTERTRFSLGGVYNIIFDMVVTDAVTGEIIEPTRRVQADLSAPGGMAALALEQRGQTEKVRVTDFLTMVLENELSGAYVVTPS